MRRDRIVPLIIAVALFMENMDSTVIATSLPAIAADIGTNPLALKLAVTSYLLSLAVFIPASGWTADRFGARTVFRTAIGVFVLGSIACAMSSSLTDFVFARILQGMGGAHGQISSRFTLGGPNQCGHYSGVSRYVFAGLGSVSCTSFCAGLTRFLISWPGLKWSLHRCPIATASPVLGLRASLGGRLCREKLPKPRISIRCPLARDSASASSRVFTAASTCAAGMAGMAWASRAISSERFRVSGMDSERG